MQSLTRNLLEWYRLNRVKYPWRLTRQPYRIWLSEILLQQTRIPVVLKFYQKILREYPNFKALAAAEDSKFIAQWSGIGYYRRAQNMLACAREIVQKHDAKFPADLPSLLKLPGIGKYTAGALRNICFNSLTPAIDGNIRRVLSRLTMSEKNLEKNFMELGSGTRSSDFFQSLMELGERICLPNPQCGLCPVRRSCKARKAGKQQVFPAKQIRKRIKTFHWYLLLLESNGSVYFSQNSARPFLRHAWIFPDLLGTKKMLQKELIRRFRNDCGIRLQGLTERKVIKHAVTFRNIYVHVISPASFELNGSRGKWLTREDLAQHPTSSITHKILALWNAEHLPKRRSGRAIHK
jgi:A/G-specific adenine glycosylase